MVILLSTQFFPLLDICVMLGEQHFGYAIFFLPAPARRYGSPLTSFASFSIRLSLRGYPAIELSELCSFYPSNEEPPAAYRPRGLRRGSLLAIRLCRGRRG